MASKNSIDNTVRDAVKSHMASVKSLDNRTSVQKNPVASTFNSENNEPYSNGSDIDRRRVRMAVRHAMKNCNSHPASFANDANAHSHSSSRVELAVQNAMRDHLPKSVPSTPNSQSPLDRTDVENAIRKILNKEKTELLASRAINDPRAVESAVRNAIKRHLPGIRSDTATRNPFYQPSCVGSERGHLMREMLY
ncbi:hypothetical protein T484DRAFT_1757870 [Baffinella frigidus]|nr:hypothetical protein T484DRAFT_1757870 [Cryptophyta sp. CCMP2293]